MTRTFTGRHMTAIFVVFFGVVIAVNFYMARLAIDTFGGTVVENSYVASQRFNGWLAAARAQRALGWKADVAVDTQRRTEIDLSTGGVAISGASVGGVAHHPLGRAPDVMLHFSATAPGRFRSIEPLPAGRWLVHLVIRRGGHEMRMIETLQ